MVAYSSPQRVLVIGLDVGDGKLIHDWSREGLLPVFRSLIEGGTWASLNTTAETLHVSAWPSLYTGTHPGKHGVYYTFQPIPGSQNIRRFGPDQYGQPPVWQLLSEAGKRCVIFDAPYTHPQKNFNGIQIFEWGTWAWYWHPMSVPPKLLRQMTDQCGTYPVGFEANQVGIGALDLANLHQCLIRAANAKAKAARWLMAHAQWDLLWVVFGETHPAAHYFWPDPQAGVACDPTDFTGRLLREIYQAIDQAVGEIIESVKEDITLYIISGDGVGPNYAGWHLLPQVLERLGFMSVSNPSHIHATAPAAKEAYKKDFLKMIRDLVPSSVRQTLSQYLPAHWRDSLMSRWTTVNIDWSRTQAFCLPTDLEGCIRLNVIGREPQGIVRPGAEYEAICIKLIASLEQLTNPRTGRPAVRQVVRVDGAFAGERRDYLPDLIVLWSEETKISAVHSPTFGLVEAPSPDARTGTHHSPGFVIAHGPSVQPGYPLTEGHIVDFAPTVLSEFGLLRPDYMDGRVWSDLLLK
jgi:predicted AlkP superfamily phosphohydrolase/phosphomutase